jgi:hypothetical protein
MMPHYVNPAYRIVDIDHEVPVRLIGPDGRQHRQLSRALSSVRAGLSFNERVAKRALAVFVEFLNTLDPKHPDPADAFVQDVDRCRRTIDRYLKIMSVRTRDIGGGCMWLTPKPQDHRRVAGTLVAIGRVTSALTHELYGGQDPSKADRSASRVSAGRRISVERDGQIRLDTDRRLRIGSDPTLMPRLEDPRVYDRWQEGMLAVQAPEALVRSMAMLRFAGMRVFQASGATLHDVFCLGERHSVPVPNKGDRSRERTLHKKLPPAEWQLLMEYVAGSRMRATGMSLRDIRLIAADRRRWPELMDLPLLTENRVDHITYDRLYRVTRAAAEAMDLFLDDEEYRSGGRKRFVGLHLLRHEFVYERLDEIKAMHESKQAAARHALIRYMGWRGDAMLEWYSGHHRIGSLSRAAVDHNERITARISGKVQPVGRDEYDDGLERLRLAIADL